jgi:hypothetical protein
MAGDGFERRHPALECNHGLDERWFGGRGLCLPILEGHICYGHWIKLQGRTYAQTHPYFEYDEKTGEWAGTSGLINYKITVSDDGKTFTGQQSGKSGVPGPNPYAAGGTSYAGITLNGTKVEVDKRLFP